MDQKYIPAYQAIVKDLSKDAVNAGVLKVLDELAPMILKKHDCTLREDGRLFLMSNLALIVVRPWQLVNEKSFLESNPHTIPDDISKILDAAAEIARSRQLREVTARHIVEAVARVYSRLTIASLEMWG